MSSAVEEFNIKTDDFEVTACGCSDNVQEINQEMLRPVRDTLQGKPQIEGSEI